MFNTFSLIAKSTTVAVTAAGLALLTAPTAIAATFQYSTLTNKATFTEGSEAVGDLTYDGRFTNTVVNPFSGSEQTFSGFFQVQSGSLGEAVSLSAVQQTPTDRTETGSSGIIQIDYLATPQPVSTVPGAFSVPPGLTEFDFKFVPAPVAGRPTIISNGWTVTSSAESVPEPSAVLALLSLSGLFLGTKRALK